MPELDYRNDNIICKHLINSWLLPGTIIDRGMALCPDCEGKKFRNQRGTIIRKVGPFSVIQDKNESPPHYQPQLIPQPAQQPLPPPPSSTCCRGL